MAFELLLLALELDDTDLIIASYYLFEKNLKAMLKRSGLILTACLIKNVGLS
jgi:hypothetical protein